MAWFDLNYSAEDIAREARLITDAMSAGGRLGYRQRTSIDGSPICLTFEFDDRARAEFITEALRQRGENVEGVFDGIQLAA